MSSSPFSRRLKDVVLAGLALPWDAAFAVRGRLDARRIQRWSSAGGARVVVVAPHPDDEAAGCAGTILLHRERGDAVAVVHVTDGGASRALGLGRDEMVRRRRAEAEDAAAILDVRIRWLDLPEGRWSVDELTELLEAVLTELDPDLVYAPSCVDFHPEHRRVAASLARTLEARAAASLSGADAGAARGRTDEPRWPLVRVYEVQVPLTSVLVNRVAPIGRVAARVRRALEAYRTQLGSLRCTLRIKRYAGLRHRAGGAAELFWELPGQIYAALHRGPSDAAASFRGVRRMPLTDPLAYLRGTADRRRLAAAAADLERARGR